ncbi:MAG: DNA-directed RNA polymerase subunit omega [Candidatus Aminicenantales bacterium]
METFGKIDSKFRFVILASKRAKQLLRGAKPKLRAKSKNPIRLAQIEIQEGLIPYEILKSKKEDVAESDERVFSGDDLSDEIADSGETEDAEEDAHEDRKPDEGEKEIEEDEESEEDEGDEEKEDD